MSSLNPAVLADLYRDELLQNVLPFWETHSPDREQGGYFTSLDRTGRVYDTDKFMWPQARQAWTFAKLYNSLNQKPAWLEMARLGADFLAHYGRDEQGDWYFALDRSGRPLVKAYNIFSDCFAAMAFAQVGLAAGDPSAQEIALSSFGRILKRLDNPKGIYNKTFQNTRPLRSLALPMILVNLTFEMKELLSPDEFQTILESTVAEVMELFVDEKQGLVFEHVSPDGTHPECYEGRLLNPGHGLETMWFILDAARLQGNAALIDRTVDMMLKLLEYAWDKEYQGLYYFMDAENKPPLQLEWDQKLWWVHLEALVGLAKAFTSTGRIECWRWLEKIHSYTWTRFPDPEFGEWFGYLSRRGEPLLELKGNKWKGCFHLPRALFLCWQEFASLAEKSTQGGQAV